MAEKDLKRINRQGLLEMLLEASEENSRLQADNEALHAKLSEQELKLTECGSIAEASLKLSGIFEAAQTAAGIYLENVERVSGNASAEAERIELETKKKCDEMTENAKRESELLLTSAKSESEQLLASAKSESEQLLTNSRRESEQMVTEAERKRDEIVAQTKIQVDAVWEMLRKRMDNYIEAHTELQNELRNITNGIFTPRTAATENTSQAVGEGDNENIADNSHFVEQQL